MSRVIRFAWVRSPRGRVLHMAPGRVEGDLTRCGLLVKLGWHWQRNRKPCTEPACRHCARA